MLYRIGVILLSILLLASIATADTQCVTIDTTAWDDVTRPINPPFLIERQRQLNHRHATAARLVFEAMGSFDRMWVEVDDICFENPLNFVPSNVVTEPPLRNRIFVFLENAEINRRLVEAEELIREEEVRTNNLCSATLDEINQRLDAEIDPIQNLQEAKAVFKRIFKKVARCLRARAIE